MRECVLNNRVLILERQVDNYNSTTGVLLFKSHEIDTLELPWKENQRNISRIPTGTYPFTKYQYKGKPALWLRDIPNRSEILIHYGTKPIHTKGCILVKETNWINKVADKGLIVIL